MALDASAQAEGGEVPLPTRVVINVDSAQRALFRIAVPDLQGKALLGTQAAEIIRNDLRLVSLFQILDARSFIANLDQEGIGISKSAWSAIGAQGVVKGRISQRGNSISVDMRLYGIARGESPVLVEHYAGAVVNLRGFMHDFANQILKVLTGRAGAFDTKLVYARKLGPGRKDIYVADFDGNGPHRVSNGQGTSMLPAFGPGGAIWYSQLWDTGMRILRSGTSTPVIKGRGLNMGVAFCGNRMYFSSTRDGNSEIYSAAPDGSDIRRLTQHPGIDVSPTCGPPGKIIFVSSRHGGPQVFMMSTAGGEPQRLTFKGAHNQTPAYCEGGGERFLAFAGRDGGSFDIFTLNMRTGEYTRLTQGQGNNQDPTFSPDCRMLAFASTRGGIFVSDLDGLNQNLVVPGRTSTVRWGR